VATSLTITVLADVAKAVQGIDSIDKRTESWGSNLKSAGLAIAGAFSVSKIEGWAKEWLAAGLDAKRAAKNVQVTFGDAADGVKKWAEDTGAAFGYTTSEAEKAAAKVGVALRGYGLSQTDAAAASEKLVQRAADMSKVLGVDSEQVLAKVETAMRGRTAGLKDYGVQVEKGASSTEVLNAFMDQTATYAGQADTGMGKFHATMGDLTEQLGLALIPVLNAVLPLVQSLGNWARDHHTIFVAIVLVIAGLAAVFSLAATAASVFAIASLGALWPILLVVAAVAALVVGVVLVIKYWSDLVGWFHTAADAVVGVIDKFQILILIFGGPLGLAIVGLRHFHDVWNDILGAVNAVVGAIQKVWDLAGKAWGVISKIPGVGKAGPGGAAGAPAPAGYGASPQAAPVVLAPTITISGDIGDPTLAGRRIVAALESWVQTNGRKRIAALVQP
jgi:hypothetical protein